MGSGQGRTIAAGLVLAAVLAGCGGGKSGSAASPSASQVLSSGTGTTAVNGPPLATESVKRDGGNFHFTITSTRVQGQLLTVTIKLSEDKGGPDTDSFNDISSGGSVQLIDARNLKEYNVVSDSGGNSVSSDPDDGDDISPGQSYAGEYVFAAPPSNVSNVTVQIGSLPPLNNVPIQR